MGDKNPNKLKKKKKAVTEKPVVEIETKEPIIIKKVKKQK